MRGMQNKTIKKALTNKLNDWLETIKDPEVREAARKDVIVTGGAIPSLIMGDPVKDYDVYFRTKSTTILVAQYYTKLFGEMYPDRLAPYVKQAEIYNIKGELEERVVIWVSDAGITSATDTDDANEESVEDVEREEDTSLLKYRPVFLSENAISLSHTVQLVTRFYGSPEEIHDNFDFIHAMCWFDLYNNELHTPIQALRSMQSMSLYYVGSLYPVCSLFRLRKFIKRGWKVSAGEILKIALQISDIDLSDPKVLKEQLVGVDALYFNMLITALSATNNEAFKDENGKVSIPTPYVIKVIDKVFSDE